MQGREGIVYIDRLESTQIRCQAKHTPERLTPGRLQPAGAAGSGTDSFGARSRILMGSVRCRLAS
jgi:hypothetical protein